jgi:hypothetical protein
MNWLGKILNGGKTIVGAILSVIATAGLILTPEDLATLQLILESTNTVGTITMAIGLLHKLIKAAQGLGAHDK